MLGGCGGLKRTHFSHFLYMEGVVVMKELIFHTFYLRDTVVVLKDLIFYSFVFGRLWWF